SGVPPQDASAVAIAITENNVTDRFVIVAVLYLKTRLNLLAGGSLSGTRIRECRAFLRKDHSEQLRGLRLAGVLRHLVSCARLLVLEHWRPRRCWLRRSLCIRLTRACDELGNERERGDGISSGESHGHSVRIKSSDYCSLKRSVRSRAINFACSRKLSAKRR